ncbi:MAG: Rpp14/Pop5 family protein [Candidatus Bathyarchaeia archaeon]
MKRTKRRYVALRLDCEVAPAEREFLDAAWRAVTQLYGEYGASLTSLALIEYDVEGKSAVLRTSLVSVDMMRASLASITRLGGREAAVHVLAVSGTLKALRAKL